MTNSPLYVNDVAPCKVDTPPDGDCAANDNEPENGSALLDDIVAALRRFIWLPREIDYAITAAYVLLTYVVRDAFDHAPRLAIWSPSAGYGKSSRGGRCGARRAVPLKHELLGRGITGRNIQDELGRFGLHSRQKTTGGRGCYFVLHLLYTAGALRSGVGGPV